MHFFIKSGFQEKTGFACIKLLRVPWGSYRNPFFTFSEKSMFYKKCKSGINPHLTVKSYPGPQTSFFSLYLYSDNLILTIFRWFSTYKMYSRPKP